MGGPYNTQSTLEPKITYPYPDWYSEGISAGTGQYGLDNFRIPGAFQSHDPNVGRMRFGEGPGGYKAFQADLLRQEKETGIPVSALGQLFLRLVSPEDTQATIDTVAEAGEEGADGGGGGGRVQVGENIIPAPILEALQLIMGRREANRSAAERQLAATMSVAPKLAPGKTFPGMEKGGLADVLLGMITGMGAGSSGMLDSIRNPKQVPVDMGLLNKIGQQEPDLGYGSDISGAQALAKMIFDLALRSPQYAASSGGGGGEITDEQIAAMLGGGG